MKTKKSIFGIIFPILLFFTLNVTAQVDYEEEDNKQEKQTEEDQGFWQRTNDTLKSWYNNVEMELEEVRESIAESFREGEKKVELDSEKTLDEIEEKYRQLKLKGDRLTEATKEESKELKAEMDEIYKEIKSDLRKLRNEIAKEKNEKENNAD